MIESNATPVRLRAVTEGSIGTTAFFRNRVLFNTLLGKMKSDGQEHYNILFHACSVGAEVYSLLISYLTGGYDKHFTLALSATDREQEFLDYAMLGCYPKIVLSSMTAAEKFFFQVVNQNATIDHELRNKISFLPASNFIDYSSNDPFDVVFLLNALIYVPAELQAKTLDGIARYNEGLLVTTAFHADSIMEDLARNSYRPFLKNIKAIHEAWTDRRITVSGDELRPGIFAKWSLPKFSQVDDFEFKYCAIFEKYNR